MGEVVVEVLALDEAIERRQRLLDAAGMSRDELARRAESYLLDAPQLALWSDIEELDWLIDGRIGQC